MKLIWAPQPDITTFELAQCLGLLIAQGQSRLTTSIVEQTFEKLPDAAKRHFRSTGAKAA